MTKETEATEEGKKVVSLSGLGRMPSVELQHLIFSVTDKGDRDGHSCRKTE